MEWQDMVNGGYEFFGAFAIMLSIIKLHKDKFVAGVSWMHTAFFMSWGWWNCYYYPYLEQWASFYGGIAIVICNTVWLCQMIYYVRNPNPKYAELKNE